MIAVPVLAVLLACLHTVLALHAMWLDTEKTSYTHGHLVALVSVWLLWQGRKACAALPASASKPALLALFAAGAAWVATVQSGIQLAEMLLLPILLTLAVWAAQGASRAKHSAFAFAYLYFAMPIWDIGNDILQWGTVYANRVLLRLLGIPTFFEGNAVQIPDGVFHIEGGCSGLHFFMVALAIGALLGELRKDRWPTRIKLLVLAAMLAVLTNWVRVLTIILAGHYTHMQSYLVRVSHYGYGWVLFAIAMALYFWLERKIPQEPEAPAPPQQPVAAPWRAQLAMVMVLVVIAAWHSLSARPASVNLAVPSANSGWQRSEAVWQPKVIGADATLSARYTHDADSVDLYTAAYGHQEQDKEFSAYANNLLAGLQPVPLPDLNTTLPLRLMAGRDATGTYLIGVDYHVGDGAYTSAFRAQLGYARQSMLGLRSPPTQLRVFRAACQPDCTAAAASIHRFLSVFTSPGREP